ncbi:hypothetical protein BABINDRAFT_159667 [Babjeviella inositovora NRRL Y-12698]|uniref:Uncharacterized protein n=1 Tax=Babjeviella inositovora NRRL Y-12698 TaxID=984486 RepID=A0A1E3QZW2_9ASCO|nr:uncharacterized protein BABINDRAFT_159667 [Babjeviella inositovora NRRL Y-12698]ODQ83229.1 hypothetical protein BABINDRAFT_159667 [Babjeviella inositovora NRRL Y-12698]
MRTSGMRLSAIDSRMNAYKSVPNRGKDFNSSPAISRVRVSLPFNSLGGLVNKSSLKKKKRQLEFSRAKGFCSRWFDRPAKPVVFLSELGSMIPSRGGKEEPLLF